MADELICVMGLGPKRVYVMGLSACALAVVLGFLHLSARGTGPVSVSLLSRETTGQDTWVSMKVRNNSSVQVVLLAKGSLTGTYTFEMEGRTNFSSFATGAVRLKPGSSTTFYFLLPEEAHNWRIGVDYAMNPPVFPLPDIIMRWALRHGIIHLGEFQAWSPRFA